MKLHYFDQDKADSDDGLLILAMQQGYVPKTCLLAGVVVMEQVYRQSDPCAGCSCPREKCEGRPVRL